jgi:hypothetical protein
MFWSAARSRWECECGKSIAVTVVAKCSTKAADQYPQSENETDHGSLSVSLQGVMRLARSHNPARIGRASQWIH